MNATNLVCEESQNRLVFHAESGGIRFEEIAFVLEAKSENPFLVIPKPIGINAVKMIIAEIERLKA